MAKIYDTTIKRLLDKYAPETLITFRKLQSGGWFDVECRQARSRVSRLEQHYQNTNVSADRANWVYCLKKMHVIFNKKCTEHTISHIKQAEGNSKNM